MIRLFLLLNFDCSACGYRVLILNLVTKAIEVSQTVLGVEECLLKEEDAVMQPVFNFNLPSLFSFVGSGVQLTDLFLHYPSPSQYSTTIVIARDKQETLSF